MKRTVTTEDFFTPPETVARCLELVEKFHPLDEFSAIVEPSAGAGAFLEQLPKHSRIGLDINPRHPEVIPADFITWTPPTASGKVLTIGNPPFGHRAALAVKFLEVACEYSDVVAFILPRSFRKYTFQNRVNLHFHLDDEFDCEHFETATKQSVIVKSVFQVWQRQPNQRQKIVPPKSHQDFELTHAHLSRTSPAKLQYLRNEFDFAIPQVGANFTPRNPDQVTKGSYWFVKAHHNNVQRTFEILDFSFLDDMNTAHKSISKGDIITAYSIAKVTMLKP